MAQIIRRLAVTPGITSLVCVTAQHRQMLDQVLGLFSITPDKDLDVMREGQGLTWITTAASGAAPSSARTAARSACETPGAGATGQ